MGDLKPDQTADNLESDHTLFCFCGRIDPAHVTQLRANANLPCVVPGGASFQNFLPRAGTEEMLVAAQEFAAGNGAPILVLGGDSGTGKTHLLEAIGRATVARERSVRYEQVPSLLVAIRRTYGRQEADDPLVEAEAAHLLILDDMGLQKDSDWTMETITSLVDERYRNHRRLVVATNKSERELAQNGNFRLASRLFDTTSGIVNTITNTASDYRLEAQA